jgi:superfamily II DNA/RNA helicase
LFHFGWIRIRRRRPNVDVSLGFQRVKYLILLFQVAVFFGGLPIKKDEENLKEKKPHIVVGTPGRLLALVQSRALDLKNIKFFVLDECDKMIGDDGKIHT